MERNIILSDGQEVVIKSAYDCNASRSLICVCDKNGVLLAEFGGDFPDFDDEEKFIRKVEEEIAWFEHN